MEPEIATSELFAAIVEQAPDAMICADPAGAIRVWNRAAEAMFGYAAAEVLGRSLDVIIPERFRAAHWAGFLKAVETGEIRLGNRVMTTRSVHKDGSRLYVDLSFGLVKNRAGTVTGVLAIGRRSNRATS
jgi:PAS domain S-box-containing protein